MITTSAFVGFSMPIERRFFYLFAFYLSILNSSDGRVVRASSSGAVDSGLIPSRVKPMNLRLLFIASLLDVQH